MKTLIVFKYEKIDIESHVFKEVWRASFKNDEELMKAVLDYSGRGFYCQIV